MGSIRRGAALFAAETLCGSIRASKVCARQRIHSTIGLIHTTRLPIFFDDPPEALNRVMELLPLNLEPSSFPKHLEKYLALQHEPAYAAFCAGIVPNTTYAIGGIRVGALRRMAKEIAAHPQRAQFLAEQVRAFERVTPSYEAVMVHLLAVAYAKTPFDVLTREVRRGAAYIDNWALCDSFASTLRKRLLNDTRGEAFVDALIVSREPFEARLGIVIAMGRSSTEARSAFLSWIFARIELVRLDSEPVSMAFAWMLSQFVQTNDAQIRAFVKHWPADSLTLKRLLQKIDTSLKYDASLRKLYHELAESFQKDQVVKRTETGEPLQGKLF